MRGNKEKKRMKKGYLGVMLDCSRNAVMSVAELKNFILTLKKTGYNCLQLYTEDTYEIGRAAIRVSPREVYESGIERD